jgi:hypothetical protein
LAAATQARALARDRDPNADDRSQANRTLKVYDVRELIHTIPNYPYQGNISPHSNAIWSTEERRMGGGGGGNLFGGGGGTNEKPTAETVATAEQLVKLIQDTVAPTSWRDAGGDIGQIRVLNGALVVTQNGEGHRQVEELLRQLRDQQGHLVRVRAHWLLVQPAQLVSLLIGDANAPLREVDVAAMEKLPADVVHYRGEIVCFSGQTVHITAGRIRNAVYDVNPIVGSDAVAFDPAMTGIESGAVLQVTPSVQSDAKSATLDLHSVVADASLEGRIDLVNSATVATTKPTNRPGGADWDATASASIDRANVLSQELHTTVRVKLGPAVLVGGMTSEPTPRAATAGAQWVLVLQVTAG